MDRNRCKGLTHVGIVIAIGIAMGSYNHASDSSGWKEVAPQGGGFTADFPAAPTSSKVGKGAFELNKERVTAKGAIFTLYWKLREKPFTQAAADAYLKAQAKGMAQGGKGKVLKEKEITFGGNTGREFTVELDGSIMRCRALVIGKLTCTQIVQGKTAESVNSQDAERFFKSFKLSKKEEK